MSFYGWLRLQVERENNGGEMDMWVFIDAVAVPPTATQLRAYPHDNGRKHRKGTRETRLCVKKPPVTSGATTIRRSGVWGLSSSLLFPDQASAWTTPSSGGVSRKGRRARRDEDPRKMAVTFPGCGKSVACSMPLGWCRHIARHISNTHRKSRKTS